MIFSLYIEPFILARTLRIWHNFTMSKELSSYEKAEIIVQALAKRYPLSSSALEYENAWQLLVATILAAQCTDARVNTVTPRLFSLWPGPAELMRAGRDELEEVIHSTGFFRNKAKNLLACARMTHEIYGDVLPKTIDELIKLPGVARKTANVVLFGAYGINAGIAVDTHVKRISYRLGLTESQNPVRIEQDLMGIFPNNEWGNVNLRLVSFGRDVCDARKPACDICEFEYFCPKKEPAGKKARAE